MAVAGQESGLDRPVGEGGDKNSAATAAALTSCCVCSGLVQEPVQLDCLHDCCRKCLHRCASADRAALDAAHLLDRCADGGKTVRCPQCGHVSSNVHEDNRNVFVAMLAQATRAAPGAATVRCDLCPPSDGGEQLVAAAFSCAECGKFLCASCKGWHAKFKKQHVVTPLAPSPGGGDGGGGCSLIAGAAATTTSAAATKHRLCSDHQKEVDRYCFRCRLPKCLVCALACTQAGHDTRRLDDERTSDHVSLTRRRLGKEQQQLDADLAAAAARSSSLVGRLGAARDADEADLTRRKQLLLDAVDQAHASCVEALRRRYDGLTAAAVEAVARADVARQRAGRASLYGDALRQSGDVTSLLEQQSRLLSWLAVLQAEAGAVLVAVGQAEAGCGNAHADVPPERMVAALSAWLGLPGANGADQPPPPQQQQQKRGVTAGTSDDGGSKQQQQPLQNEASRPRAADHWQRAPRNHGVVRLGEPCSQFKASGIPPSSSMAVTADGHVLLAAGRGGLREYSASGRQLSEWTAQKSDAGVVLVSALEDGRVAVAVPPEPCVLLLGRQRANAAAWTEVARIDGLPSAPSSMSFYGHVVAVTTAASDSPRRGGGPRLLTLLPLSSAGGPSAAHFERVLEYDVQSVALTACTVIVASQEPVVCDGDDVSGDGARRQRWLVEAFGYIGCDGGEPALWRCERAEPVASLCTPPSGSVVYLATRVGGASGSGSVMAISGDDGRQLLEVLSSGGGKGRGGGGGGATVNGRQPLLAVALTLRSATVLAFLSADGSTVTIHPITGWA